MALVIGGKSLTKDSITPNGAVVEPAFLDGSTSALAAPDQMYLYRHGVRTNGIYYLNPGGLGANQFYIDFTWTEGVPVVMVLSNRMGTDPFGDTTYSTLTSASVTVEGTYSSARDFNVFVGLPYWPYLGDSVIQGVYNNTNTYSTSDAVELGSMTKSAVWQYAGWTSGYAFDDPRDIRLLGSTSGNPGMYDYHALNGFDFSTYDYGNTCPGNYGGAPWWYGSCWSGSYFGGGSSGSYQNGPYWTSSGGDYYAYGAIYLGFYRADFRGEND